MMKSLLTHRSMLILFVALSAADLGLTLWLIQRTDGRVYESNPVAAWSMAQGGELGLAVFKAAIVAIVLLSTAVVYRFRPRTSEGVLRLGCAVVLAVVLYSSALYARLPPRERLPDDPDDPARTAALDADFERQKEFDQLKDKVREEVAMGRCTLQDGVAQLAATQRGIDPAFHMVLNSYVYPNGNVEERLAAYLIREAIQYCLNRPEFAWKRTLEFEQDFIALYGKPPPDVHRKLLQISAPSAREPDASPVQFN